MNFSSITKDTPASVLIYVADETISTVSELETGLAGHQYIVLVGNQVWDKTFAHGFTRTTSAWEAVAGGGGSTGSALFIATPNTTTCAEIITAIEAGKVVMAKDANRYYVLQAYTPLIVRFVSTNVNNFGNYTYTWAVNALNTWSYSYGYPSVFVATYGTTSYNDIKTALWAGQTVICHRKFTVPDELIEQYILTFCGPGGASFTHTDQNISNETFSRAVKVDSNGNWQTTDLLSNAMTAGTGITIEDATITSGGVSKVVKKISATDSSKVFIAEYGETKYAEVQAAIAAGKMVFCKAPYEDMNKEKNSNDSDIIMIPFSYSNLSANPPYYSFSCLDTDIYSNITTLKANDVWGDIYCAPVYNDCGLGIWHNGNTINVKVDNTTIGFDDDGKLKTLSSDKIEKLEAEIAELKTIIEKLNK